MIAQAGATFAKRGPRPAKTPFSPLTPYIADKRWNIDRLDIATGLSGEMDSIKTCKQISTLN